MKFLIVTFAPTLKKEDKFYSYAPYVYEMNIWSKYIEELGIISPIVYEDKLLLSSFDKEPQIFPIKPISFVSIPAIFISLFRIPLLLIQLFKAMQWAEHIHLRCPGNVGLLGCFVQILFPKKPKTVKYAGNWDPTSKQPRSYRFQKWILSNTFLTRNCKVLVYGDWPNQSENIVPFFTASYSEEEIEEVQIRDISIVKKQIAMSRTFRNDESIEEGQMLNRVQHDDSNRHSQLDWESHDLENDQQIATLHTPRNDKSVEGEQMLNRVLHDGIQRHSALDAESVTNKLKFIYVGGLTPGKQPLLSVQVVHELKRKGYNVQLDMYGDGVEKAKITDYILDNSLEGIIILHGNTSKEIVKKAYQQAHFSLFISKSEGWPKVVAEAMFWGCVPLTSAVSCVPEMLGNGSRGTIVVANSHEIVSVIEGYVKNNEMYKIHAQNAMEWSRQFTLEKFEEEIGRLF